MSSITPLPRQGEFSEISHRRPAPVQLSIDIAEANEVYADRLAQHLRAIYDLPIMTNSESDSNLVVRFVTPDGKTAVDLEPAQLEGQEYDITIDVSEITITSSGVGGWHYGITALKNLVKTVNSGTWSMSLGTVSDAPDLAWRGLSMDIARSFFPMDELKRLIDVLATYRYNVLHLHLTDDQGWRLESAAFPTLTELGGTTAVDGGRSGFLTQADWVELQAVAAARGITVVPEIDIPGHTNAALNALPELNKGGVAAEVYTGADVGFSRIFTEVEATLPFLTTIFTELAQVTDGRYIHFGGDEALEVSAEDYTVLVEHTMKVITDAGKVPVGWQEIASATLHDDVIMQLWNRRQNPPEIAEQSKIGRRSIISPSNRSYFDMSSRPGQGIGVNWDTEISLREAYEWDPRSAVSGLDPDTVLGVEAAMWTEFVHDFDTLTTLLLPRLAATAEVGWTPLESREWTNFLSRVQAESVDWHDAGITFDKDDLGD